MRETQETWGSIPGWGRALGEGNGHPLQYSCLENPMDRGAWRAAVHGVTESDTNKYVCGTHAHVPTHTRAQLPRGVWNLPRPGIKPVPLALAGSLATTEPPGMSPLVYFTIKNKFKMSISRHPIPYIFLWAPPSFSHPPSSSGITTLLSLGFLILLLFTSIILKF